MDGHIHILNSIHSFIVSKISKQHKSNNSNTAETFDLRSGNLAVKVMSGKLLEQNVESIMYVILLWIDTFFIWFFYMERIPVNDKYKIHKAFDRQIQSFGGTTLSNYLKEIISKGARPYEGEVSYLVEYNKEITL